MTIGLNFFPRSNYVTNCNGKGKGGGEVDTSPIECVVLDLSKGGRDKEIPQSKGDIKTSTGEGKTREKKKKIPRRGRDQTTRHWSNARNPII